MDASAPAKPADDAVRRQHDESDDQDTDNEQVDFHIGAGLNAQAPGFIFGVGYSYRFDRLFSWRP